MIGICLIVGVGALSGIRQQLVAELAIVAATICYAGAAIFGRSFERIDPMLPAAGSLVCGAIVLVPLEPRRRSAVDARAVRPLDRRR